jgi:hypothetical protein
MSLSSRLFPCRLIKKPNLRFDGGKDLTDYGVLIYPGKYVVPCASSLHLPEPLGIRLGPSYSVGPPSFRNMAARLVLYLIHPNGPPGLLIQVHVVLHPISYNPSG